MSRADACSYDELPYDDLAFYHTHPSNLAVVATLCGLEPPAVEGCRVLELGCGTGFNLLAMKQSLPGARLVGIDRSRRQIEHGRALAAAVGADDVELHARDLADIDESFGRFDYVIAHGLFSWVPAGVREAILAVCKRHLGPHGIAYLSYNTYPGWHLRTILRDVLRFHAPAEAPPLEQVTRARAALEQLLGELPDLDTDYARLLRAEVESLRRDSDTYVFHEFLEADNQPLRVEEFARLATSQRLRFVGEARYGTNSFTQRGNLARALTGVSDDLIRREQYHDFLRNRSFRQSLLCHADLAPSWSPSARALGRLHALARVEPLGAAADGGEQFRLDGKQVLTTAEPVLRGVLHCLHQAWPRTISVQDLAAAVVHRLGADATAPDVPPLRRVGASVLLGYADDLWWLFAYVPPFVSDPGERPRACALARYLAKQGAEITNLLHRRIQLTAAERAALGRLDGRTTREELASDLTMTRQAVADCLSRLAESALLVA
jgi:SAM-dependent methyltransferase